MRKKKRAFTKKDDILDARKCITMVASILLGSPRCNPSRASPALFCFFFGFAWIFHINLVLKCAARFRVNLRQKRETKKNGKTNRKEVNNENRDYYYTLEKELESKATHTDTPSITALWARCQKCWVWLPISACNAVHVIVRCDLSRDTARLTCCFRFEFQRESKCSKLKSRKHRSRKKKKLSVIPRLLGEIRIPLTPLCAHSFNEKSKTKKKEVSLK